MLAKFKDEYGTDWTVNPKDVVAVTAAVPLAGRYIDENDKSLGMEAVPGTEISVIRLRGKQDNNTKRVLGTVLAVTDALNAVDTKP